MIYDDDFDLEQYKIYCASHHTDDPAELTRRLFNQTRAISNKLNRQREREQMKQEIIAEVLKQIRIEVNNDASPVIKEIQRDIENLFSK